MGRSEYWVSDRGRVPEVPGGAARRLAGGQQHRAVGLTGWGEVSTGRHSARVFVRGRVPEVPGCAARRLAGGQRHRAVGPTGWGEVSTGCLIVVGFLRYLVVLHAAWLVDSGIALWGLQDGEKYPHDSNSVFVLAKTFWPHYHYLVPYDYKSGEFGTYDCGCSTAFIRVWAALGLAWDLRTVEPATIQQAMADAAKTKRALKECIESIVAKQTLPDEHYLKRG
ncbi:hypothetical protein O0L34_g2125 [Tuta absoluta]|nr:hypothetical protein O0L34_g2125 [Tuta absoluta]